MTRKELIEKHMDILMNNIRIAEGYKFLAENASRANMHQLEQGHLKDAERIEKDILQIKQTILKLL